MTGKRAINAALLGGELIFSASRSSGPGGQNVNKVNSKITLKFDVAHSNALTAEEKETIIRKLATQLTGNGVLVVTAQEKRSQFQNKEEAILKLEKLLARAFEKKKLRKPTKPSKSAVQKRIKAKRGHSEKKSWRRRPLGE